MNIWKDFEVTNKEAIGRARQGNEVLKTVKIRKLKYCIWVRRCEERRGDRWYENTGRTRASRLDNL